MHISVLLNPQSRTCIRVLTPTHSHTYTHVSTKPGATLRERYLYQPLIHLPTLPWPGSLHRVWEMRTAGREDIRNCYCMSLMMCALLDRHAVGGREKKNGRVSEREQSVSSLWWYLSNLIFQLVLVELNTVLEEREVREKRGRRNEITLDTVHHEYSYTICFSWEYHEKSFPLNFPLINFCLLISVFNRNS